MEVEEDPLRNLQLANVIDSEIKNQKVPGFGKREMHDSDKENIMLS